MITEKRALPIGVTYNGTRHKELEVRARLVRDMIAGANDPLTTANKANYEVCCLASQIVKLGDIPKEEINGALLLDMFEQDYDVLAEAAETARKRAGEFREPAEAAGPEEPEAGNPSGDEGAPGGPGPAQDGLQQG